MSIAGDDEELERYRIGFEPDLNLPREMLPRWDHYTAYDRDWMMFQCAFRGVNHRGSPQILRARILSLSREQRDTLGWLHYTCTTSKSSSDSFAFKLRTVLDLWSVSLPLMLKVKLHNLQPLRHACESRNLKIEPMEPPDDQRQELDIWWVMVGESDDDIQPLRRLLAQRFYGFPEHETDSEGSQDSEHNQANRRARLRQALLRVPHADSRELKAIKQETLEYNGHMYELDIDPHIPSDPTKYNVHHRSGIVPQKPKAWWIAQCGLRGFDTNGTMQKLQARLRDRDPEVDRNGDMLDRLRLAILEREWHLISSPERKAAKNVERLLWETVDGALILRIDDRLKNDVKRECAFLRISCDEFRIPRFLWSHAPYSCTWLVVGGDIDECERLKRSIIEATDEDQFELEPDAIPVSAIVLHAGRGPMMDRYYPGPRLVNQHDSQLTCNATEGRWTPAEASSSTLPPSSHSRPGTTVHRPSRSNRDQPRTGHPYIRHRVPE